MRTSISALTTIYSYIAINSASDPRMDDMRLHCYHRRRCASNMVHPKMEHSPAPGTLRFLLSSIFCPVCRQFRRKWAGYSVSNSSIGGLTYNCSSIEWYSNKNINKFEMCSRFISEYFIWVLTCWSGIGAVSPCDGRSPESLINDLRNISEGMAVHRMSLSPKLTPHMTICEWSNGKWKYVFYNDSNIINVGNCRTFKKSNRSSHSQWKT